jgi:hypothetical protein
MQMGYCINTSYGHHWSSSPPQKCSKRGQKLQQKLTTMMIYMTFISNSIRTVGIMWDGKHTPQRDHRSERLPFKQSCEVIFNRIKCTRFIKTRAGDYLCSRWSTQLSRIFVADNHTIARAQDVHHIARRRRPKHPRVLALWRRRAHGPPSCARPPAAMSSPPSRACLLPGAQKP